MEGESYKYSGIELSVGVAQELVVEAFAGQTVKRGTIIREIDALHQKLGGAATISSNLTSILKKALSNLQDNGQAENITYGTWAIFSEGRQQETLPVLDLEADVQEAEEDIPILRSYGEGDKAVYVYYYPVYEQFAKKSGSSSFPIKIGYTAGSIQARVVSQVATALPELPKIALVLRSPLASSIEKSLHLMLSTRGRKIPDIPGSEWFNTSIQEIEQLVMVIDPNLIK